MVQSSSNSVLAIYFPLPGAMDSPFCNEGYFGAYREFSPYAAEQGVAVCFVRADSYLGGMEFSGGWQFDQSGELQECAGFSADSILNKSGLQKSFDAGARVLNHPEIELASSDKTVTYERYASYMPKSVRFDKNAPKQSLEQIETDKLVLKPVDGAAGRGIFVIDRNEPVPEEVVTGGLEYLVQEFVDTSKGIPGIVDGMHDLRLFLFNGVAKIAYVRVPKEGSYLANIACGGSMFQVPVEKVPAEVMDVAKDIDCGFEQYRPRFYSADFMFGNGERPYLVELNSHPGFPSTSFTTPEYRRTYFDSLLEIIR